MKTYQKITQEADGRLFGWYLVESKYEGAEPDFDVITEYAVYPHDNGTFISEHTPTLYAFGSYATLEEALEAVREKINSKLELKKTLEDAGAKFEEVAKKNSLDERYRDVVVEKKVPTNEELKKKYKPYQNFNENLEKFQKARLNTFAKINAAYNRFDTYK